MKRNTKKVAVFISIFALAVFISVAMASAQSSVTYGINGIYKVTGFSSCNPAEPGIMEVDYTFNINGTGELSGVGRSISASGGSSNTFWANFTYEVTAEGRIDFSYPEGGLHVDFGAFNVTMDGGPSHGVISPDRKTITISCGYPVALHVIEFNGVPMEPGPDTWCVTSFTGMRIR